MISIEQKTQDVLPPVPWTSRDVWYGTLALIGLWLVTFAGLYWGRSAALRLGISTLIDLTELLLLVPVGWLAVRKHGATLEMLGFRRPPPGALQLGCGLLVLVTFINGIYASILALFNLRMQADLSPLFAAAGGPWGILIAGAVVAPLVEELFFRGFVFAGLRPRYGWQRAAVISSILFALLHLELTALPPIFLLGYIFAYLYQRTNSIWPGILMHASTNALALAAAYFIFRMSLP